MEKQYWDAIFPAQRTTAESPDEILAKWAKRIIEDEGDAGLYYAQQLIGPAPTPNKSAQVTRKNRAANSQTVVVKASAEFFGELSKWVSKLDEAESREMYELRHPAE